MQYGIVLPNMGVDIHTLGELAHDAEEAGWDGVFLWDGLDLEIGDPARQATYDPWIALACIAMRTHRLRLGPMVTPLARRRPWKVARETVSLDHLSGGRLTLAVGLGATSDGAFWKVGEPLDRKVRARRLDEGLEIVTGLWSGRPFSFSGEQYHVREMRFLPRPIQHPRIPVWVVGAWPRQQSMQRALRYDGILPAKFDAYGSGLMSPDDIRALSDFAAEHRAQPTPFDIVMEGETPGDDPARAAEMIRPLAQAGATWWMENVFISPWNSGGLEGMRTRIKQKPPRID